MSIDTARSTHQAYTALAAINDALDLLFDASLWSMSDAEVIGLVEAEEKLMARMSGASLIGIREFDSRGIAKAQGASSSGAYLRDRYHLGAGSANGRIRQAEALDTRYPRVAAALRDARISAEHMRVIVKALDTLPRWATPADRDQAEADLLEAAETMDPDLLRKVAAHLREVLDPDGAEERLKDAVSQRTLSFTDRGDGTQRITGILDHASAALIRAGIDPLAAPRPGPDGTRDERPAGRRRAEALVELVDLALRYADRDDIANSRGARPHLIITADLSALMAITGAPLPMTSSGEHLTLETLRRIACDAGVSRVFLDPDSVPLDVGRRDRFVTAPIWDALLARDVGCVFPGCDRPAAWAIAHHLAHWADGGETCLDNMCLLCAYHHETVHHQGWEIRLGPDRRPELIPPAWLDPERKPRRNTYWQIRSDSARP